METAIGLVPRAQHEHLPEMGPRAPVPRIAHNGEINTLRGNINWMRAREALFGRRVRRDIKKIPRS